MAYTSKRTPSKTSRVITLGEIDSETVNEVIQFIYDINEEDAKKTQKEPQKNLFFNFFSHFFNQIEFLKTY